MTCVIIFSYQDFWQTMASGLCCIIREWVFWPQHITPSYNRYRSVNSLFVFEAISRITEPSHRIHSTQQKHSDRTRYLPILYRWIKLKVCLLICYFSIYIHSFIQVTIYVSLELFKGFFLFRSYLLSLIISIDLGSQPFKLYILNQWEAKHTKHTQNNMYYW